MTQEWRPTADLGVTKTIAASEAKHKQLTLEVGILGKLFGSRAHAPTNILGLIAVLLLLFALIYTFVPHDSSFTAKEMWGVVAPIITTIIGYIIGKNEARK